MLRVSTPVVELTRIAAAASAEAHAGATTSDVAFATAVAAAACWLAIRPTIIMAALIRTE
jgi:hypothetical protein